MYILFGVLGVLILVNVFFVFNFPRKNENKLGGTQTILNGAQAYIFPISEPSYLPILNTAIERPTLTAKSAVIYDVRSSRFLYSKNPDGRLPIASLTKLLTAVVVLENLDLSDIVHISEESVRADEEKQTLYLDENIRARDLLKMMLIESSNDAAYALMHHASGKGIDVVGLMDRKAIELGMNDSIFHDPAGLNDDALSTSEDLIKLVKYSLQFQELWSILSEKTAQVYSIDGRIEHVLDSTNQLLGVIPDVAGGKTGYTDIALGCMLLVVDVPGKNDKLISVVLGSTERFIDTEKLVNWAKRAHSWD